MKKRNLEEKAEEGCKDPILERLVSKLVGKFFRIVPVIRAGGRFTDRYNKTVGYQIRTIDGEKCAVWILPEDPGAKKFKSKYKFTIQIPGAIDFLQKVEKKYNKIALA